VARPTLIDTEEHAMPHLLDPRRIATHATYLAALHELDALMAEDPDASANRRIDELFRLIEAYELQPPEPASRTA
jgi:antitoxin component HigA of HigAB toxin-antitoxin module